jgi:MarR family transcriptional regulator for hemolysin
MPVLNAMEADGPLVRRRDPENRRVHAVELTAKGASAFDRMRGAARGFDHRLRGGMSEADVARLNELLDRLASNVTAANRTIARARP